MHRKSALNKSLNVWSLKRSPHDDYKAIYLQKLTSVNVFQSLQGSKQSLNVAKDHREIKLDNDFITEHSDICSTPWDEIDK